VSGIAQLMRGATSRAGRSASRDSTTPADSKSGDAESIDPLDMPRLDVLDEEFGEDAAASLHARRRRIGSDGKRMEIHALIKLTPTQIRPLRNSNPASGSQIRLMRT
jgi:hypothetical protein